MATTPLLIRQDFSKLPETIGSLIHDMDGPQATFLLVFLFQSHAWLEMCYSTPEVIDM